MQDRLDPEVMPVGNEREFRSSGNPEKRKKLHVSGMGFQKVEYILPDPFPCNAPDGNISTRYIGQESVMLNPATAKVFMSGRSQAVRLPKAFRFETDEVRIRAEEGAVILEPLEDDWAWLDGLYSLGPLDPDVVDATELPVPRQVRPDLDALK